MFERRKCRVLMPIMFMMLEVIGIVEGVFIANAIIHSNYFVIALSIIATVVLLYVSISKTNRIYETRCKKKSKFHTNEKRHISFNKR